MLNISKENDTFCKRSYGWLTKESETEARCLLKQPSLSTLLT